MKIFRLLFLSMLCGVAFPTFGQFNIGTVDPGPYTPGSTIAATFTIDPAICIPQGNRFNLRLSDASGNFSPGVIIGFYDTFYSTFVNGTIPIGTAIGVGYKIRIESTSPALISNESAPFSIQSLPVVTVNLSTNRPFTPADNQAIGFCSSQTGAAADIILNKGTSSGDVTATLTNELDHSTSNITLSPSATFRPLEAHYTMFTKVTMPNGTVATRAYFIINNKTNTNLNTSGSNTVCLQDGVGGTLAYPIALNSLIENFPGDIYKVNWGDQTTTTYTLCDLKSGSIQHTYINSSCGQTITSGGVTTYNSFGITLQLANPFCGNVGTPISTSARVISITQNIINAPLLGCTNTDITFRNASVLGENPNNNGPCLPDNATFNWYVDGVFIQSGSINDQLIHRFASNGPHIIELESISATGCQGPKARHEICIQDSPKPAFTLLTTTICKGDAITPTNTSVVDNTCSNTATYSWSVTPSNGVIYGGGTDATSQQPQFIFANTGVYQVTLTINTPSCGSVSTLPQRVVVNETPTATLAPNAALCSVNTYDFNPTTPGPTRTTFSGTSFDLADTYTWTVTGGAHTFTGGSNQNTKYPSIQFLDYTTYTVSVTHKNSCGSVTRTQTISFTPAPTVNAGIDQAICFNDMVSLSGSVTGAALTRVWVGGSGTFSDRNDVNSTYTPSAAEQAAGQVTLILRATTTLPAPCDVIDDNIIITIKPLVTVSSANTKSICTGTNVAYTPTSATAGTTFAWTAAGTANAGGFTASGTGNINDVLTNSNPTSNATVTYTITPTGNGCIGVPFTLTVTVTPNPIVTPTAVSLNICSGQSAGITLTSNLPNTSYTWTSTNSAGVLGNSNNATPTLSTTINDVLFNNTTTAGTVDYTITPISAEGCPGTPVTITITVEPEPTTPNAGVDEDICNATSFTFKGNQPAVGTGLWTQVSAFPGVTFTNPDRFDGIANGLTAGNTYVFRWTITGAASCSPKSDEVSITISPLSVGGTTAGSATVCAGGNSGTITLSGQTGNVIRWESSADGGVTYPDVINNTTTSLTYTNLTTTTYFRAVVQSGVCAPTISTPSIITVNQGVNTANAGLDQVLCNTISATLNGNLPTASNTGLWTLTSGQSGITFVDATLPNTIVNGLVAGQTYTFRWTISGLAPCPPSVDDVTIKIDLPSNGGVTAGSATVCAGNNNNQIILSGQVGNIVRWESSTDGGTLWSPINETTATITIANLTATTRYRAVVQSDVCAEAFSTTVDITVNPGTVQADAGPSNLTICNETSFTLVGNNPGLSTGLWTLSPAQPGVTIVSPSSPTTLVTGLVPGQNYEFTWTIAGLSPCPETTDKISILNLLPISSNTLTNVGTVCTGQNITMTGSTPTGGNGTYTYVWEFSTNNGTRWDPVATNGTGQNLTITANQETRFRRVVNSGGACSSTSGDVLVQVRPPIGNNIISTPPPICINTAAAEIIGSLPTGGDGTSYSYQWQRSIDNTSTSWQDISGAAGQNYLPGVLTLTTYFRRVVSTPTCTNVNSNASSSVMVEVKPDAKAEFTAQSTTSCAPFRIDNTNIRALAYPDRNATYRWFVRTSSATTPIGTGINFPGYEILTPNTAVDIILEVTSSLGCQTNSISMPFSTVQSIEASFTTTRTSACESSVTFRNTSTTLTGVSFEWFVDGQRRSTATEFGLQSFPPDPRGVDKEYKVRLVVTSICGTDDFEQSIIVKTVPPRPALEPSRTSGCSILPVTFNIQSTAETSNTFLINFDDGTGTIRYTYGQPINKSFENLGTQPKNFNVTITAENDCGSTPGVPIVIRVLPSQIRTSFFLDGNQPATVCVGDEIIFTNNTTGAEQYVYDFDDGTLPTTILTTGFDMRRYAFATPGVYDVTMVASNTCPSVALPRTITITVLAAPVANFTANVQSGCTGFTAQFTSTSTGTSSYEWDFGDGFIPAGPTTTYTFNRPPGIYRVRLRAINSLGCDNISTKEGFITVSPPPNADFQVLPGNTIGVPNYTFTFNDLDRTTDPGKTYSWNFGDEETSSSKNASHRYKDVGEYRVTFTVENAAGCKTTTFQIVRITGVPSHLYVPNSFIPNGTSIPLQTFYAVGSGIASWRMQVFNKWGQVLWETTKLDEGKPIETWDGTFKGVPQPQGVYFWKIDVNFINGTEWKGMSYGNSAPKRTGEIYLIR